MDTPRAHTPDSLSWPAALEQAAPAPSELWTRGRHELLGRVPSIAVVGSRAATPYGLDQARRFGRELARVGVCVVSGLARGVDQAAHEGALEAGGDTVAVLGCGVDRPWPDGPTTDRIGREGLLVSEFPPGTGPRRHHFPLRNRLISCLSQAVLVIEAAARSGSLITARWALEQGRPVYALPGRVDHPLAAGVLGLLRAGATPIGGPSDLLEDLFDLHPEARPEPEPGAASDLLEALRGETLTADELALRLGRSIGVTLADLLELELQDRVRRAPGGFFQVM